MRAPTPILLLLLLAACESPEEAAKANAAKIAADTAECQSRGFTPGTDHFQTCMKILADNRAADDSGGLSRVRAGTETLGQGRPTLHSNSGN